VKKCVSNVQLHRGSSTRYSAATPVSALHHTLLPPLPHMAPPKSNDLKARIPFLFFRDGYKVKKICQLLGVHKTLIYTCLQNYMRFGMTSNPYRCHHGRPRILKHTHIDFLRQFMGSRHTSYLDEVQQELRTELGVFASLPTLSRTFCCLGMTRKRVWKQAIGFFYLIFLSCFC
jgi:transposase